MTVTKHPLVLLFLILTLVMPVLAADSIKEEIPYGNNPQTGHYASVNGIEMYYETYGSGDPLLVIHGNGQSIADMHFQIAHFSRDYKVIVSDSRAHGKSGRGEGTLTYMQMLEDYNALLGQLNITGADVFGWSDGGILALLLAIHHPDKVNKLAVMGANLRPGQSAIEAWVPGLLDPLSVYSIMLFGTFIETGAGMLQGINERIDAYLEEKRGQGLSRVAHAVIAVSAIGVSAILSLWGITNLIAQGYGTMAWGFLLVYVIPLLSIGLYRIIKSDSQ